MVTAAPLAIPATPGWGRAHFREQVVFKDRGVLVSGKRAWWRPMLPGTGEAYTGPLFATPSGETAMTFPAQTGKDGIIEAWAPEPVRLELAVWADYYPGVNAVVTALFTEDTEGVVLLQDHIQDADAHPQYATDLDLIDHAAAQNAHPLSGDSGNVIEWRPNGLFVPTGAVPPEYVTDAELDAELATALADYYTKDQADALFATVAALDAALARIAALEAQVATLQGEMTAHVHAAGDWDYLAGTSVPDGTP